MRASNGFRVDLPDWMEEFSEKLPRSLPTARERMAVAVSLADQNVRRKTGGPFGALVVAVDSGEVVSLGVNRVEPQLCSAAHAEIVALSVAQRVMGTWSLAETRLGPLQFLRTLRHVLRGGSLVRRAVAAVRRHQGRCRGLGIRRGRQAA